MSLLRKEIFQGYFSSFVPFSRNGSDLERGQFEMKWLYHVSVQGNVLNILTCRKKASSPPPLPCTALDYTSRKCSRMKCLQRSTTRLINRNDN